MLGDLGSLKGGLGVILGVLGRFWKVLEGPGRDLGGVLVDLESLQGALEGILS